jgi:hypothetical protein
MTEQQHAQILTLLTSEDDDAFHRGIDLARAVGTDAFWLSLAEGTEIDATGRIGKASPPPPALAPIGGERQVHVVLWALRSLGRLDHREQLTVRFLSHDLSPFEGLPALQELNLWRCRVRSLAGLSRLTSLRCLRVWCWGRHIRTLEDLAGLTLLEELDVTSRKLSSLAGIERLTSLRSVSLESPRLRSVAELSGLVALERLTVRGQALTGLHGIEGLHQLRELCLVDPAQPIVGSDALETLAVIERLPSLQRLEIHTTAGSDVYEGDAIHAFLRSASTRSGHAIRSDAVQTATPEPSEET